MKRVRICRHYCAGTPLSASRVVRKTRLFSAVFPQTKRLLLSFRTRLIFFDPNSRTTISIALPHVAPNPIPTNEPFEPYSLKLSNPTKRNARIFCTIWKIFYIFNLFKIIRAQKVQYFFYKLFTLKLKLNFSQNPLISYFLEIFHICIKYKFFYWYVFLHFCKFIEFFVFSRNVYNFVRVIFSKIHFVLKILSYHIII